MNDDSFLNSFAEHWLRVLYLESRLLLGSCLLILLLLLSGGLVARAGEGDCQVCGGRKLCQDCYPAGSGKNYTDSLCWDCEGLGLCNSCKGAGTCFYCEGNGFSGGCFQCGLDSDEE